jgi:hypothetical protein
MEKYNLIWLASYPKSGNTWVRTFLTALTHKGELNLNELDYNEIYSEKDFFKKFVRKDPEKFTARELETERRKLLHFFCKTRAAPLFMKLHDSFITSSFDDLPQFHSGLPTGAIYIIRNPLDVAVSFARYLGISIDDVISRYICQPGATILMKNRFPREIGTWARHVESWKNQSVIPTLFVKYEDLTNSPLATFREIIKFSGLNFSDEAISEAIQKSAFKVLKSKEAEKGFHEKLVQEIPFFHTGESDQWKKELTESQVERISVINRSSMKMFGY